MLQDVDILVFPEAGLTGIILCNNRKEIRPYLIEIPSPESRTIPCFTKYCNTVSKNKSIVIVHNISKWLDRNCNN